jgi:hypothetical protein
MTLSHIQELESFGSEWDSHSTAREEHLSELAASWVANQMSLYSLQLEGKLRM